MQERQDVADQPTDVTVVEVMLVHQLVVVMEHTFVYVHQAVNGDVAAVTLERLQEHIVDVQLTFADVSKGQILQFADLMAVEQVHQCVQVHPFN